MCAIHFNGNSDQIEWVSAHPSYLNSFRVGVCKGGVLNRGLEIFFSGWSSMNDALRVLNSFSNTTDVHFKIVNSAVNVK